MNFTFTGKPESKIDIPYFEDARAQDTKYYSSTKKLAQALKEVRNELAELGCYNITFQEGYFGVKPKRFGYLITFGWNGAQGKINLAGLPIRSSEYSRGYDTKVGKVRVQALLILRDQLISYRQSPVFLTDTMPILQHILMDGRTMAEWLNQGGSLPALPETVDADFVEVEK